VAESVVQRPRILVVALRSFLLRCTQATPFAAALPGLRWFPDGVGSRPQNCVWGGCCPRGDPGRCSRYRAKFCAPGTCQTLLHAWTQPPRLPRIIVGNKALCGCDGCVFIEQVEPIELLTEFCRVFQETMAPLHVMKGGVRLLRPMFLAGIGGSRPVQVGTPVRLRCPIGRSGGS
jgi:hypothetical protein